MADIMIIDDSADFCEGMKIVLEKAGHKVRCMGDGKAALAAVIQSPPDAVLLDMIMPEMDGPSFLEVVRSYLRLQSLPVVVLTGLPDSPMVERMQYLKVNAVLVKGKASMGDIQKALEEAVSRVPGS